MYWQEEERSETFEVPKEILDLAFKIDCPTLPVDHAWALSQAIIALLPWFAEEGAMHIIHGGESSNGWQRPQEGSALLYLSRRTPLTLRLPAGRVEEAQRRLTGATLNVDGSPLRLGEGKPRPLAKTTTLYARYVAGDEADEDAFLRASIEKLRGRGIAFKKILCGRSHTLQTPNGPIETRSLMVSDLGLGDSIRLQESGLGPHRAIGCGLFIAHKTV